MDGERCCLVLLSLHQEEAVLLRRLAAAEGVEPAPLAHEAMMWGLRRLHEGDGVGQGLVGGRAYPLRRIVDLRHVPIDSGPDLLLDRATEILECGHTGCTFVVTYPARFFDGDARRCALCATPAQRARAGHHTPRGLASHSSRRALRSGVQRMAARTVPEST